MWDVPGEDDNTSHNPSEYPRSARRKPGFGSTERSWFQRRTDGFRRGRHFMVVIIGNIFVTITVAGP